MSAAEPVWFSTYSGRAKRSTASPNNEAICAKITETNDRLSRVFMIVPFFYIHSVGMYIG